MARIKVPPEVAVSPQDATPLTFDMLSGLFKDQSGNVYTLGDLAGSRPAQRLRTWYRENRPQRVD